jgi:hypothetical protein
MPDSHRYRSDALKTYMTSSSPVEPYSVPPTTPRFGLPIAVHTMVRPAADNIPEIELPELDEACVVFADAFLRAVAT